MNLTKNDYIRYAIMTTTIKTPIIPSEQTFAKVHGVHELHLEAICIFAAIGFFLDDDTYWKDEKVLRPASNHFYDAQGKLIESTPWFQWHYSPRDINFKQTLDEFSHLFETIVAEQSYQRKVILPLSGGLDSRTQAAALKHCNATVFSYSYEFKHGYEETKIARQIANSCDFEFQSFTIPKGYLWDVIDQLSELNHCYSDFTTPRQMAIFDAFETMGDQFSLGHWGDVLFDNMDLPQLSSEDELIYIKKKLLKKGGMKLASDLWYSWHLEGDFDSYFKSRLEALLKTIDIGDTNSKLRAFKSMYWAPRWTSINLSIFSAKHPVCLPYYDDRMCQFICTVPEQYLNNRQLQIAYLKARAPKLANITWQDQRPFNLNNFQRNKMPYNIPYKIGNKLKRMLHQQLGKTYSQRNWELQFLGEDNEKQLKEYILHNQLDTWIPSTLLEGYFNAFTKENHLENAHTMNMLLVLSKFNEENQR